MREDVCWNAISAEARSAGRHQARLDRYQYGWWGRRRHLKIAAGHEARWYPPCAAGLGRRGLAFLLAFVPDPATVPTATLRIVDLLLKGFI